MSIRMGYGGKAVIGSSGVLNEVISWQLQEKAKTVETTSMQNAATAPVPETFEPATIGYTGTITMNYDPTDSDGQETLVAGLKVAVKLYPEGDTTGFKYWSGNVVVDAVTSDGNVAAKIGKSFTFTGTGALTRTTAP